MNSRTVYAVAAGLLLWYGAVAATECLPHPTETSAVNIGTTNVDTTVLNNTTSHTQVEVCVWSISPTRRSATVEVAAITFTGDAAGIDTVATATILARLRLAAVRGMIDNSYLTCTTTRDTVRLYHAGSVIRNGSGPLTTFAAASGGATHYYDLEYYYPTGEGIASIREVGSGQIGGSIQ